MVLFCLSERQQGEEYNMEKRDIDTTLDVKNEELEELVAVYAKDRTVDNLNELINCIRKCRVLSPATVNDKKQPVPSFLKTKEGETFLPIYTSKEQIPAEPKTPAVVNLPYLAINQMVLRQELDVKGIVINPFSNNLVFKRELAQKIDAVEKLVKEQKVQKVELTEEQYAIFERQRFEREFFPKKFFTEKKAFMDALCEKKETYLDELYEESYQQKRMYPYLEEDFSVMVMNVEEGLLVVRVDFPTRDMYLNGCIRVYMVWDEKKETGRYFTIQTTEKPGENQLGEIVFDGRYAKHIIAPEEGSEVALVIDLFKGSDIITS